MKLDQNAEAVVFKNTHHDDIVKAEALLQAAAFEFLAGECKSILATSTIRKAEHALSMANLQAFKSVLWPESSSFRDSSDRARFRELIDAIGFLDKATGSYWPFVTQTDRRNFLTTASGLLSSNWACAA
jgi:hypothetical protein